MRIGDCVMIGPDVIVIGKLHHTDSLDIPMIDQGDYEKAPIVIREDVWIGARAIILPGVVIGTGSIVGAGAVVTRDASPYTVVAGVPAKVIGHRAGASPVDAPVVAGLDASETRSNPSG